MSTDFFERMELETGTKLNNVQRQAIEHDQGPLLLLASPGSGKTTTLNFKIAYLILEKKVNPRSILGLTFSKAAAHEMAERFHDWFHHLIGTTASFSTIHSFAFQVVRDYAATNRLHYTIIEGAIEKSSSPRSEQPLHKRMILRRIFQDINRSVITEDQMDELLRMISFVKNRLLSQKDLETLKTTIKHFPEIYLAYEQFKLRDPLHPLMDFDDMLTYANTILAENASLLATYQQRFEYILTDESQDTSLVQHQLVEKLALPNNNLCVVADDDQTLYSWRGADVSKIIHFKDTYPDATVLYMEQNYRSSQEIVETANRFIQRNKVRHPKKMFTKNPSSRPIVVETLPAYEDQTRYVIRHLREETNYQEVAILYRNNSSSINVMNALDLAGIPFYIKDIDHKFFSHWVLKDILHFIELANDPSDVDLLAQIHTKFAGYISKVQLQRLYELRNGENVFDLLIQHVEMKFYQKKQLKTIKSVFAAIRMARPASALTLIRNELGYEKNLKKMSDSLGFSIDFLLEMLNTIENVASDLPTALAFKERILHLEQLMRQAKSNKHQNAVTLSTFHSAKGLEFDRVFMIDLINGVLPSSDNIKSYKDGQLEEMEEAVRLFYVGMTRARHDLHLLSYRYKSKPVEESLFIGNIRHILHPNDTAKIAHARSQRVTEKASIPILPVQQNMRIRHTAFGDGTIIHVMDDVLDIQFDKGIDKQLSLQVCSENHLLTIL
ncbi:ATP-dependent helicase [Exiguobacterium antarcticum]|uniref:DNA 3'-5' helicase n=1 Tax=Exiguobacterium antarcticum TaxID=132920 RepID=A0ABT6R5R5_9BACL|nr:UvrD-helicase domain-containing protein [Exiguobacterium antarcticum]AFS69825.1 UvrD/REP helicase [Exiguobacterium antarcticum B7]MDI3235619.1 UvrD-helicase domain-containing protein [Exiguobacterium antarcticum]